MWHSINCGCGYYSVLFFLSENLLTDSDEDFSEIDSSFAAK